MKNEKNAQFAKNADEKQYKTVFSVIIDMRKKTIILIRLMALLFVAGMVCTACGSSVNMHKHSRSNCDCPSF